jgi:hypothetical protein
MFGLTTTRRLRTEVAAAEHETARQRRRAETAEGRASTAVFNRKQALQQNAELDAANRRLEARNLELGRRLAMLTEADPDYTASLERRLARALKSCARWMDATWVEARHADRLQQRLDDCLGLNTSQVMDGRRWQHTRVDKKGAVS